MHPSTMPEGASPQPDADARLETLRRLIDLGPAFLAASVPVAVIAGTLSLLNAALTVHWLASSRSRVIDPGLFIESWLVVLLLVATILWRFTSRATVLSRAALAPVMPLALATVVTTLLFCTRGDAFALSIVWVTFYGLMLRSLGHFAPRPIAVLGTAFLTAGLSMMVFVFFRLSTLTGYDRSDRQAALIMASTFGLFHLIYAVMVSRVRRHIHQ